MIESSFYFSSVWESDPFPSAFPLQDISFVDEDYSCSFGDDSFSTSTYDFSSNSSDIDNINLDEFECNVPVSDSFVSQILGESLPGLDYNLIDNFHNQSSYINSFNSGSVTSKSEQSIECAYSCTKLWSRMSAEEQSRTLLAISEATRYMGIREQLEVIKIIDPHLEISADMKEFALDVALLNDAKWERIQDFFMKHALSLPLQKQSIKSGKTSRATKALAKKSNSSVSRTSRKQRQKKQKVSELDVKRRKQVKQGLKEEKSGLFVYEKIVKFSSPLEDEDVNILE